ncbi:MAG: hypothetical protein ACYDG6_01245 [Thermincolia bacterium]
MFKKICTSCGKNSYSSNNTIKWLCPYCNQDISTVEAEVAEGALKKPEGPEFLKNKDVV